MTAPITSDAPAGTSEAAASPAAGQAPTDTTNGTTTGTTTAAVFVAPAGGPAGPDGTDGPRGRRAPGERVRSSSRDDAAPRDGDTPDDDTDTDDGDGGGKKGGKAADWRVEDLPSGAQKLIADLRKENGTRRSEATEAKKLREAAEAKAAAGDERFTNAVEALTRALGLTPELADEQQPSPEELLGEVSSKYQQSRIELAVYRAAAAHGGDPDALLDSRAFLNNASRLDPADEGFDQAIAAAIGDAVATNPKLRAAPATRPAAAPSGGDFGGGPAEPIGPERWSVDDFRARRKGAAR